MTHALFTASYRGDAVWYEYSLRSMKKFCHGFLPPVVCVGSEDADQFQEIVDRNYPEARVAILDGTGVERAQIAMMRIDEMCPDADYLWLMGSDCIVGSEMTPEPFFENGKPVMLYNTFDHLLKFAPGVAPWKRGTERILQMEVPVETMRRVPTIATPEMYRRVRAHVERAHRKPFDRFIIDNHRINRDTSETNILGGYAWQYMRETFEWENMDQAYEECMSKYPNPVLQFWSHGGLDKPCDRDMKYSGGSTLGKTPRQLFSELLGT